MNTEERIRRLEEEIARLKGEKPSFVTKPRRHYDPTEGMRMPRSALDAMVAAVPDNVMKDIVADASRGLAPRSMIPPARSPSPKGTGWVQDRGFPDRSREIELVDRMVEHFVGGPNETSRLREQAEKRVDEGINNQMRRRV